MTGNRLKGQLIACIVVHHQNRDIAAAVIDTEVVEVPVTVSDLENTLETLQNPPKSTGTPNTISS